MQLEQLLDALALELEKDIKVIDNVVYQNYTLSDNNVILYRTSSEEEYDDIYELLDTLYENDRILEAKVKLYLIDYLVSDTFPTGPSNQSFKDILNELAKLHTEINNYK